MLTAQTKYGMIFGISKFDTYPSGKIRECVLKNPNSIETPYGTFVPQYTEADLQERQKKDRSSIKFYENGTVKSIALESKTMVNTSYGNFWAELVTFYDEGSLKRFFPLNGKITGYWTEEDESAMASDMTLDLSIGSITAKIMGVLLYPSGKIRSVTLWPGQSLEIQTPLGGVMCRTGFSLYENGALKSLEPYEHVTVTTELGDIIAYDPEALGIHGDSNSLIFDEQGDVMGITTSVNGVLVTNDLGMVTRYEPKEVASYVDDNDTVLLPLKIAFTKEEIVLTSSDTQRVSRENNDFLLYRSDLVPKAGGCSGSCGSCSSGCSI